MKKFTDFYKFSYTPMGAIYEGSLCVVCPSCQQEGRIAMEDIDFVFRCKYCPATKTVSRSWKDNIYGKCIHCKQKFGQLWFDEYAKAVETVCPHCNKQTPAECNQIVTGLTLLNDGKVSDGLDPIFGFKLYFSGNFRGNTVWAYDRCHLKYLIGYISATLRADGGTQTQSDGLPRFMKLAKNREGLLKFLTKMQDK